MHDHHNGLSSPDNKVRFKTDNLRILWMPNQTNHLQWLNTRYATIIQELHGTTTGETNDKLIELLELNQQIQAQMILHLLAEQKQLQIDTDNQLMEISHYLQDIITSRIREAENLEKAR